MNIEIINPQTVKIDGIIHGGLAASAIANPKSVAELEQAYGDYFAFLVEASNERDIALARVSELEVFAPEYEAKVKAGKLADAVARKNAAQADIDLLS